MRDPIEQAPVLRLSRPEYCSGSMPLKTGESWSDAGSRKLGCRAERLLPLADARHIVASFIRFAGSRPQCASRAPITIPAEKSHPHFQDLCIKMKNHQGLVANGANEWWRYILAIGLAFALSLVLMAVIGVVLHIADLDTHDLVLRLQDPGRPVGFFVFVGIVFLFVLFAFVISIRVVHRKSFADVVGAWAWRSFGAGFAIWAVASIAMVLIDVALAPSGFQVTVNRETPLLAMAALGGLAIQTFAEEFVFRGYLTQGLLTATKRTIPTAVISGLLFGAVHIPNGAPQAVSATLSGVVLALIAIRTGGIAVTCGQHLANNFFAAVVFVSSDDVFRSSPGIFTQTTPHLLWWDTATSIAALIVVAVVVYRATPSRDLAVSR
jgi:membrane protease YdiL (CAAX protease family)